MPKMKTHSGAKKRFKLTATGKVRGRRRSRATSSRRSRRSASADCAGRPRSRKHDETRVKILLGAKRHGTPE